MDFLNYLTLFYELRTFVDEGATKVLFSPYFEKNWVWRLTITPLFLSIRIE